MKDNTLLPDLAAHLFAFSREGSGRTPSERELAEHFAVSRGQIREALAILEAMRIVERRAKSGIYLTTTSAGVEAMALIARAGVPLDPVQILETVELRKIHEIKAAELACARATDENYARLREILAASERRLAAGEGLAREDRDFHLEDVRGDNGRVTVTYSWFDADGHRLEWGQVLRLRGEMIVEMEDFGRGRGGRRVARLFERGPQ